MTTQEAEQRLHELHIAVEIAKASDDPSVYEAAVENLRRESMIAFQDMARVRRETAEAKVPLCIEHIESILETGVKVVVFGHHHSVMDQLYNHFQGQAVIYTGKTPQVKRDQAVERFQTDDSCRVFIGSIQAAGVGITLTASSNVVFCELDWVPGNLSQAEDRCHRIGTVNPVLIQHLVFDGSIDANMAKTVVDKQNVIDRALDKGLDLNAKEREIEAIETKTTRESATKETKRKQLDEIAAKMTASQIKAVHVALVRLASMCDGAQQVDNVGFNKIDTGIGKDLAYRESLTPRQAALGKIIVWKYRRQLGEELMEAIRG
jgi:hypothetical protein